MKILGVVGSSRKSGNTATLVRSALEAAKSDNVETDMVFLSDYSFNGCIGCESCKTTYQCIIKDDMQKLYPKIETADAIILGSPTYFYNITAKMKAFIERLYCYEIFDKNDRSIWMPLFESTGIKYASVIAICEQADVHDMGFTAEAMKMPLEALGYRVVDTVKVLHLFDKTDARKNDIALKQAMASGQKLAKTLMLRRYVDSSH